MCRKVFALSLVLLMPAAAWGTPKIAKDTKKACTVCHVKAGKPDLNDVGKCVKAHKSQLDDCEKKGGGKK